MSTQETEMELGGRTREARAPAMDPIRLVDCGRATEQTQGVTILLTFELSTPPSDRLWTYSG